MRGASFYTIYELFPILIVIFILGFVFSGKGSSFLLLSLFAAILAISYNLNTIGQYIGYTYTPVILYTLFAFFIGYLLGYIFFSQRLQKGFSYISKVPLGIRELVNKGIAKAKSEIKDIMLEEKLTRGLEKLSKREEKEIKTADGLIKRIERYLDKSVKFVKNNNLEKAILYLQKAEGLLSRTINIFNDIISLENKEEQVLYKEEKIESKEEKEIKQEEIIVPSEMKNLLLIEDQLNKEELQIEQDLVNLDEQEKRILYKLINELRNLHILINNAILSIKSGNFQQFYVYIKNATFVIRHIKNEIASEKKLIRVEEGEEIKLKKLEKEEEKINKKIINYLKKLKYLKVK